RRVVLAAAIDQPRAALTQLGRLHLADEDGVIAGIVLRDGAALEPGEGAHDERAARTVADLDAVPERDRRYAAAREVLRNRSLSCCEETRSPAVGTSKRLVRRRVLSDRDPEEGRAERQRDE